MLVVHLLFDSRDAMGANTVNTAVEAIAPRVAELTGGRTNLRILSNLADRRTATARCTIPAAELTLPDMPGGDVARLIAEANAFAVVDPYRAATHNKGIMNGIDAVCIATGNDWRAIEAGAHSYAARNGRYAALTDWHVDGNGDLYGEITLPMAVGTVGGATKVHPTARVAMKMLGVKSAGELAAGDGLRRAGPEPGRHPRPGDPRHPKGAHAPPRPAGGPGRRRGRGGSAGHCRPAGGRGQYPRRTSDES
jgi:hydroxymethylglutaryl-CoA reductase